MKKNSVTSGHDNSSIFIHLKLLLTAFFWGGTFIAAREIANRLQPFSAAFLRFTIASIILLLITRKKYGGFPGLSKTQFFRVALMGLSGIFFYNYCFFTGLQTITASRAALIVATNPIFISLFAGWLFKEKLTLLKILGILISVSGALIVIAKGDLKQIFSGAIGRGELYIFGCVGSWVAYSLISKPVMKTLSPLITISYSSAIGTVALFIPAYFEKVFTKLAGYSVLDWVSLSYLGVFGTVLGILWYLQGIRCIGAAKASQFIDFVPVSAIILAALFLGETPTRPILFGAALVISGVYLTQKRFASAA